MKKKKCEVCFIITARKKNSEDRTAKLCGECFKEGWRCEFIEDNFFFVKRSFEEGKRIRSGEDKNDKLDKIDKRKAKDNSKINKVEQQPTETNYQKKERTSKGIVILITLLSFITGAILGGMVCYFWNKRKKK